MLAGRLDTTSAPNLEAVINELPEDTKELVFDISELEHISSAGVSVSPSAYKKMNSNQGAIRIEKTNDIVYKIFEMTGLLQMLGSLHAETKGML